MRWLILSITLLFGLLGLASGDTPAPVEGAAAPPAAQPAAAGADQWPQTVQTLASALTENDPGALLSVLSDDQAIHTFDGKVADAVRLLVRTRKGILIGRWEYVHAPENLAQDVFEAIKTAEVPEELKRRMALRDEQHARRANRTAATWLSEALNAKPGDKVGVLIFWCDKPAGGEAPEVVFVLLKAEPDPEGANSKISAIAFGNPIPRPPK
jgi:hypothetical protein